MVYDWDDEEPDGDDRRQRIMFIQGLILVAAVLTGLAIGFAIDFLQGRILR